MRGECLSTLGLRMERSSAPACAAFIRVLLVIYMVFKVFVIEIVAIYVVLVVILCSDGFLAVSLCWSPRLRAEVCRLS